MGLQVWLPLINGIENQGLNGAIAPQLMGSGVTFTNGKIGNAATFPNNCNSCIYMDGLKLQTGSWCTWIKVLGEGSGSSQWIISEGRDTGSIGTNIFVNKAGTTLTAHTHKRALQTTISLNTWYHVAITFGNGIFSLYINGNLLSSISYTEDSDYAQSNDKLVLGKMSYSYTSTNNYFPLNGQLNDVRIYDHVLSPREVKEISKGLVLHYPLNRGGFGQDNHYQNSNFSTGVASYWYGVNSSSISVVVKDGRNTITGTKGTGNNIFGQTINDYSYVANSSITFTISADIYVEESGTLIIGNWITTTQASGWYGMSQTSVVWNKPNTLQVGWNKISVTKKGCTNQYDGKIVTAFGYTGTTFYATNIKFEFGEKQTPWIPNAADAEYSTLGFDDGIEYDVSGYGNNGTKVGSITYDADTPRYNTSTVFDGTTHVINNTSTIHLSNEFTISWWGKINTWRQVWEGMFLLQNTTALNSASGTYSIANAIHASTANKMTLTFRQGGTNYPFDHYEWTYTVGTWGHYACTYKDGVIIMYQNGVQTYTATIDNNSSGDYYYTIGKRVSNCNCQMSDFRIYNTALSADDILELYHTPISLSNNGTLLTQGEFEEV